MDTQKNDILDQAVAAWRERTPAETLSSTARTNLFSEIQSGEERSGLGFVPSIARAWRWAFLGSVPVVAIATVLIMVGDRGREVATSHLTATKVDGELIFTLQNGRTDHLVYRSTDPRSFDRADAVKMVANSYAENATGGPNLVFYRID
jgi:hypothetical protein